MSVRTEMTPRERMVHVLHQLKDLGLTNEEFQKLHSAEHAEEWGANLAATITHYERKVKGDLKEPGLRMLEALEAEYARRSRGRKRP